MKTENEEGIFRYGLFVSYSHWDNSYSDNYMLDIIKEVVNRVNKKLSATNERIEMWADRQIHTGKEWRAVIREHLYQSHILIAFVTSHYCRSRECRKEVKGFRTGEYDIEDTAAIDYNYSNRLNEISDYEQIRHESILERCLDPRDAIRLLIPIMWESIDDIIDGHPDIEWFANSMNSMHGKHLYPYFAIDVPISADRFNQIVETITSSLYDAIKNESLELQSHRISRENGNNKLAIREPSIITEYSNRKTRSDRAYMTSEMIIIVSKGRGDGEVHEYGLLELSKLRKGVNRYARFLAQKIARSENRDDYYEFLKMLIDGQCMWKIFLDDDGYIHSWWVFVILNRATHLELVSGNLPEDRITEAMAVNPMIPSCDYFGHLLLFGTAEQDQNTAVKTTNMLFDSFFGYIDQLSDSGVYFNSISALRRSNNGKYLAKLTGMNPIDSYCGDGSMYLYDLTHISCIAFIKDRWPELTCKYSAAFRSLPEL